MSAKPAPYAAEIVDFLNAAVSPYHAVDEAVKRLTQAGFVQIHEGSDWQLQRNGKYFFTRNTSTLAAFAVGGNYTPGNGVHVVGAHTDSPNLRVKQSSAINKHGFLEVGVEPYGGGIWYTWFDRDLSVGGRVVVEEADGSLSHRLVRVPGPILHIPSLAIHLNRSVNDEFKFNAQTHLLPILATTAKGQLEGTFGEKHHPLLLTLLAQELGCQPQAIRTVDLSVFDVQPAVLGGPLQEFIYSGRLDNLGMSFCGLTALIESLPSLAADDGVRMISLFDNEEVGSNSFQGAGSTVLESFLRRLPSSFGAGDESTAQRTIANSFLISADMAHALHPNYPEKHDGDNAPAINQGVAIKNNNNQRYATSHETGFLIKELGRRNGIPVQDFCVRNDMPCGSTIGPILAANSSIRTVDVGNPMLSMHSIRETCGATDVGHAVRLFKAYYEQIGALHRSLRLD